MEAKKTAKKETRNLRLMWKNRFSGEKGFVKLIRESKGYFENGSLEEARKFRSNTECKQAVDILRKIGEAENNDFFVASKDGSCIEAIS